ncbi:MAG: hypothetical protein KJ821_03985 [Actinobacteria bacterium]|nr:hypothetical protein [Actinomycetota bacterium]MBU4483364.1 hypothetical protein [Actinomycetota bacterium]MCG2790166.1 hypothetical protein [Actinomycetes bacterium]
MNEKEIIKNLERCPSFIRCSQNLCPLDFKLSLRVGSEPDKCRYMREPRLVKHKDKSFMQGGAIMPDDLLKFVPKSNLDWLNNTSRKRWNKIRG